MSYLAHELPGRLRLKIPSVKRNSRQAVQLRNLLEDLSGVTSATVNPMTGSVVVTFDCRAVTSTDILNLLTREGYIDLNKVMTSGQTQPVTLNRVGAVASKALLGVAIDRAFEGSALSYLAVLI